MRNTVKTVSYAARATDDCVTYLHIYADADGESHMEELDIALMPRTFFKGLPGSFSQGILVRFPARSLLLPMPHARIIA